MTRTQVYREEVFRVALPLLLSASSDREVILTSRESQLVAGTTIENFHEYFLIRRLLAWVPELYEVLFRIRQAPSRRSLLSREDSERGVIGSLDVPRYVKLRSQKHRKRTRQSIPIIRTRYSYDTPENRLALTIVQLVREAFNRSPFSSKSSEQLEVRRHRARLQVIRQKVFPLRVQTGDLARLRRETEARVARRRTGNDEAYNDLVSWIDRWHEQLGPADEESTQTVPLSFPSGEAFWNRVFEVWCVMQCFDALKRIGFVQTVMNPLHTKEDAIAVFARGEQQVRVLFQRSSALGAAKWLYQDGKPLRGIPDITLTSVGFFPLFIDAKFRETKPSIRRSEEIYKMLGYAENFNQGERQKPFHGLLMFPSPVSHHYRVQRDDKSFVDVLGASVSQKDFRNSLDELIYRWSTVSALS